MHHTRQRERVTCDWSIAHTKLARALTSGRRRPHGGGSGSGSNGGWADEKGEQILKLL
jgi:hypothetical protein